MDPAVLTCCKACCDRLNASVESLLQEIKVKSGQGVCLDCLHRGISSGGDNESSLGPESGAEAGSESSGSSHSESESSEDEDEEAEEDGDDVEAEADRAQCRVKH